MKISFDNPDKVNGLLTLTVEESDYKDTVEKELKDYRKKANYPGFRPGMVPMGLIKKQYGTSAKIDAVNKVVSNELYKYIQDNKIQMLGEPLPSDKQEPQDLEKDTDYTFVFDIAVAPEFKVELSAKDKIDYYNITIDDALIDKQVDMLTSRGGSYEKVEEYADNDMLKGDINELDDKGNTKEGGISVEAAVLMPNYININAQKELFANAKVGDIITFNPKKAYPESTAELTSLLKITKEEAENLTADFSYQVTEISRYKKAEVDQALFDSTFGEGVVKTEADFRAKIADGLKAQLAQDSDYSFLKNIRSYTENLVGTLTYPDEILKRVMLNNNKDKDEKFVEDNYAESIKQLTWHLIREQLVNQTGIKIDDNDVKETAKTAARIQFAQYGMNNVPDEYIENYAQSMLKDKNANMDGLVDRAIDVKLTNALKAIVKLNEKNISLDDFNKMMEEK